MIEIDARPLVGASRPSYRCALVGTQSRLIRIPHQYCNTRHWSSDLPLETPAQYPADRAPARRARGLRSRARALLHRCVAGKFVGRSCRIFLRARRNRSAMCWPRALYVMPWTVLARADDVIE